MTEGPYGTAADYGFEYLIYFTNYLGEKRRNVGIYSGKLHAKDQLGILDRMHNKDIDESDPNQRKFFAIEDIRNLDVEDVEKLEIRALPRYDL